MIGEQQMEIETAPLTNDRGVQEAKAQLGHIFQPDWEIHYDEPVDTLFMRRSGAGPAISYSSTKLPQVIFRLDVQTGELTGIDLTDFAKVLAHEFPPFQEILSGMRRAQWASRLPGLRRLGRYALRGLESRTREEVRGTFCLQG